MPRHTFATHAATFEVNPWVLMIWMGHKKMDETMRYVQFADAHRRVIPTELLKIRESTPDPTQRALNMLSARGNMTATSDANREEEREKPLSINNLRA